MTLRLKSVIVAGLLSLTASPSGQAQQPGPGAPPAPRGTPGGFGGLPPMSSGMAGRDLPPAPGFGRLPGGDSPPVGRDRSPPPASSPTPPFDGPPETVILVPLGDVVSMVQERFNATAVKTDTVISGDGQTVYRIRMLSADRARVWTVSVDARTGLVN